MLKICILFFIVTVKRIQISLSFFFFFYLLRILYFHCISVWFLLLEVHSAIVGRERFEVRRHGAL